jgi:hypothetical protein
MTRRAALFAIINKAPSLDDLQKTATDFDGHGIEAFIKFAAKRYGVDLYIAADAD